MIKKWAFFIIALAFISATACSAASVMPTAEPSQISITATMTALPATYTAIPPSVTPTAEPTLTTTPTEAPPTSPPSLSYQMVLPRSE